jgi:uncharacterized membrane protein YdjX (TVP38/TMEM64 family)
VIEDRSAWRWLGRAVAALAIAVVGYYAWSAWDHAALMAWMGRANPFWFFVVMSLVTIVGVPITPLYIVAGATFGTRLGLAGSLVALAVNLTLCYWIARSALRRHLESLLQRFGYDLPDLRSTRRNALHFTVFVRFTPGVPAFVKSYVLGLAGVPFPTYLGVSMLIGGTYAIAFVVMGESLLEHDLRHLAVVAVAVAVLAAGVSFWRKRRARDALA